GHPEAAAPVQLHPRRSRRRAALGGDAGRDGPVDRTGGNLGGHRHRPGPVAPGGCGPRPGRQRPRGSRGQLLSGRGRHRDGEGQRPAGGEGGAHGSRRGPGADEPGRGPEGAVAPAGLVSAHTVTPTVSDASYPALTLPLTVGVSSVAPSETTKSGGRPTLAGVARLPGE